VGVAAAIGNGPVGTVDKVADGVSGEVESTAERLAELDQNHQPLDYFRFWDKNRSLLNPEQS
jgi:hypothetical protein